MKAIRVDILTPEQKIEQLERQLEYLRSSAFEQIAELEAQRDSSICYRIKSVYVGIVHTILRLLHR